MSKKNKRMLEKKAERVNAARAERRERRTFIKALGFTLCFSAVIALVGILIITADYRAQKSLIDRYMTAVETADVSAIKACYGTNFDDPDFFINEGGIERGIKILEEQYGEGFGMKYEILSRFDYSDMVFNAGETEYILFDLDVTAYNDERSETTSQVLIMMKEPDGKWQVYEGCFEVVGFDITKSE